MKSNRQSTISAKAALRSIAALLLAVVFAFSCTACKKIGQKIDEKQQENTDNDPRKKLYEQGVAAYENWDFEEAKRCFAESKLYSNASEYITAMEEYERRYLDAVQAMDDENYPLALATFQTMPKYLNSQQYIDRIGEMEGEYNRGVALYNEKDYLGAREAFVNACGYSHSNDYIKNIDEMVGLYNRGMEMLNLGAYVDAITAFTAIRTAFEDSEDKIAFCMEHVRLSYVSLQGYIRNYNDEWEGESKIEAGTMESDFALRDTLGILFAGTADDNGLITQIRFDIPADVRSELGTDGCKDAVARCIHALNPYVFDLAELRSKISTYMSVGGGEYGVWWIRTASGTEGGIVVEVKRYYN